MTLIKRATIKEIDLIDTKRDRMTFQKISYDDLEKIIRSLLDEEVRKAYDIQSLSFPVDNPDWVVELVKRDGPPFEKRFVEINSDRIKLAAGDYLEKSVHSIAPVLGENGHWMCKVSIVEPLK